MQVYIWLCVSGLRDQGAVKKKNAWAGCFVAMCHAVVAVSRLLPPQAYVGNRVSIVDRSRDGSDRGREGCSFWLKMTKSMKKVGDTGPPPGSPV